MALPNVGELTKMCNKRACKGPICAFAHDKSELMSQTSKWKSRLCVIRNCDKQLCRNAHSEEEIVFITFIKNSGVLEDNGSRVSHQAYLYFLRQLQYYSSSAMYGTGQPSMTNQLATELIHLNLTGLEPTVPRFPFVDVSRFAEISFFIDNRMISSEPISMISSSPYPASPFSSFESMPNQVPDLMRNQYPVADPSYYYPLDLPIQMLDETPGHLQPLGHQQWPAAMFIPVNMYNHGYPSIHYQQAHLTPGM